MKQILILILLAGCSTVEPTPDKEPRWHASNDKQGYYWRDHFRHDYSNAPPVPDIK
jgi:hypothetical protein